MDLEYHGNYEIWGGDIDPAAVQIARENAEKAEVEEIVRFSLADARAFSRKEPYGRIVSNPPYGERLMEKRGSRGIVPRFWQGSTGDCQTGWRINLLSSHTEFERNLWANSGQKKENLYNGNASILFY